MIAGFVDTLPFLALCRPHSMPPVQLLRIGIEWFSQFVIYYSKLPEEFLKRIERNYLHLLFELINNFHHSKLYLFI